MASRPPHRGAPAIPDIEMALQRLRAILPIEAGQRQLCRSLRSTHQLLLCFFLEQGRAPVAGDLPGERNWPETLRRLDAAGLIVLDAGGIDSAYPFSARDRGYHVTSAYCQTEAVCAFDALAISSMFRLPTRIDATCRLGGEPIRIRQNGNELEADRNIVAAIDWSAADGDKSCAASLCTEMLFIGDESRATAWQAEQPSQRQLFTLQQAHGFISAFFLPLVNHN